MEALKKSIEAYQDRRTADRREYYWGGIEAFFGGRSKTQKLEATAQLLAVINGAGPETLDAHLTAGNFARGSELGGLYAQYLRLRPL